MGDDNVWILIDGFLGQAFSCFQVKVALGWRCHCFGMDKGYIAGCGKHVWVIGMLFPRFFENLFGFYNFGRPALLSQGDGQTGCRVSGFIFFQKFPVGFLGRFQFALQK